MHSLNFLVVTEAAGAFSAAVWTHINMYLHASGVLVPWCLSLLLLQVPGGPELPAGCPFLVALAASSKSDPALAATGDGHMFKPER
jgi:hypothetical protein